MSTKLPIKPRVIEWARESAGLSREEVVSKLKRKSITVETITAWETGGETPTLPQLEMLAYSIYKRPLALFFFPEPPEEETPEESFRTLPEYEISKMPPKLRYLIRQARVMQINLAELNDNTNPAPRKILHDLGYRPNSPVEEMSKSVRTYFNIDLDEQMSWKDSDVALKNWRALYEECGIAVFKEAFNHREGKLTVESPFSGFCLYDDTYPIIYVNNSKPKTRQIFTLFHELAHLLLRTGGVDTRIDDYIDQIDGDNKNAEILCNKFAGAFLVPDEDFNRRVSGLQIDDPAISQWANLYKVSREVILRKFLDRGDVNQSTYNGYVASWAQSRKPKPKGGSSYSNKGVYLGDRYLGLVFGKYYQKKISLEQVANYLGVKVKNIPGYEALIYRQGKAG